MEQLGLPKNKIHAALPYKGNRKDIGHEILGEGPEWRNLTDLTGLHIFAAKNIVTEGIDANNKELTRQFRQEVEQLRQEVEQLRQEIEGLRRR